MLRLLRGNKSFTRWCRRLLEAQYLLLSLLLIGRVILIFFDAFQILIGWLIYCRGGFKQLAPNISIAHLFRLPCESACLLTSVDSETSRLYACLRWVCLLARWRCYYDRVLCPGWYLYNEATGNGMQIACLEGPSLGNRRHRPH